MLSRVIDIGASIIVLATITTLVLPGRQTPAVINSTLGGFTQWTQAAMGSQPTGTLK